MMTIFAGMAEPLAPPDTLKNGVAFLEPVPNVTEAFVYTSSVKHAR